MFFKIRVAKIIVTTDNSIAIVIMIIIYLVFTNFLTESQVHFSCIRQIYFIFLISRLGCIGFVCVCVCVCVCVSAELRWTTGTLEAERQSQWHHCKGNLEGGLLYWGFQEICKCRF